LQGLSGIINFILTHEDHENEPQNNPQPLNNPQNKNEKDESPSYIRSVILILLAFNFRTDQYLDIITNLIVITIHLYELNHEYEEDSYHLHLIEKLLL